MFIALRDLRFAKGRFMLIGLVIALVAFLTTLLSGLASGLIKNNISGLIELDVTHLAFEYNNRPSYRNSMIDREMWEGWRATEGVRAAEPMGHTMFNARLPNDDPLDDVVLWGIEPGSFLEPAVLEGEQLGQVLCTLVLKATRTARKPQGLHRLVDVVAYLLILHLFD